MWVEYDVRREAGFGERQVLHRIDAGADALLTVTARKLVADDRVALMRVHDGYA